MAMIKPLCAIDRYLGPPCLGLEGVLNPIMGIGALKLKMSLG